MLFSEGIEAAEKAGLDPIKINMVPIRGINDDEIVDFATNDPEVSLSDQVHRIHALRHAGHVEARKIHFRRGNKGYC